MSDENTPNPPENGLTMRFMDSVPNWLDDWDPEKHPDLIKWYNMPKKEFLKTLYPSPEVQLMAIAETWEKVDNQSEHSTSAEDLGEQTSYLKYGRDIVPPFACGLDNAPEKSE